MTALVLAADYPERVRSLVIVNGAARAMWAPDYPIGARVSAGEPMGNCRTGSRCGRAGFRRLRAFAPSVADDDNFRRVVGRCRKPGAVAERRRARSSK